MLAPHGWLRSVGVDGYQTEQGIQIKMTESAGMGAEAEIALY
jgi:hypothetical protein